MKLLAPAGNFECLKAAVYNGADEVYLGINQFNARNNVDGFTIENLGEAVDFAHVFGVKVDLAINILFNDDEIEGAVETAVKAFNLGVDAFIIQDLGLAEILSRNYPDMELHASTQMGIHNLEGVLAIEKVGFSRVVLARETPIEEIKRIKENTNIEIEYFAHGALCVSFSGNCYLSSYMTGASGNRGRCKQLCRLPYRFCKDNKTLKSGYLLSAKDFNFIDNLALLKDAGVDIIKIEGRARRAFYVATATKQYRLALENEKVDNTALKLAFNRGYTVGYFNGNGDIISDIQNHVGIFCGNAQRVKKGKTFSEVFFSSRLDLSPKSTFKVFSNGVEKSVITAYDLNKISDKTYRITTTQNVAVGDVLNLIVDAEKEKEVLSMCKKLPIDITLYLKEQEKIRADINVSGKKIEVLGEVLQTAKTNPVTKDQLIENFNKSELFLARLSVAVLDNVFIQKKQLNEFRREVFDKVFNALTKPYHRFEIVKPIKRVEKNNAAPLNDFEIVDSESATLTAKNVIYSPEIYNENKVRAFMKNCQDSGKTAYLDLPNFATKKDIELLEKLIKETGISAVANNYYALSLLNVKVIGGGLNVYNSYTAAAHNLPFISAEGDMGALNKFPYMTFRHCPIKANLNSSCDKCAYADGYYYVLDNGKKLKLKRKKLSSCTFYLI